jgi:hypothetical protein
VNKETKTKGHDRKRELRKEEKRNAKKQANVQGRM